ncbi:hypothetical protein DPMN_182504 [Dreissena polymorpha]|uniref:Uncharacterized protein n=1 Tax=Dreissena polymorpha TaxID=45954 RepID=A0A9D4DEB9_DREPO|nr:hypothetical protein DPMN_182504 [Dreissena polymorpha]
MSMFAVSNVALDKPAIQTDTARGFESKLAGDGDTATCSTAASTSSEWESDLEDYYPISTI